MKTNKTYGEIADLINKFDEDEKQIIAYIGNDVIVPVDNFELFKLVTKEPPNDICKFNLNETDDNVVLEC